MENSFSSNSITVDHIATKFGTWHDSWAVVPCAKVCSDHIISTWMRAKWNFHHIWIVMEKLLVKWAPGHSMVLCKTAVTPLITHWSYCSLSISHGPKLICQGWVIIPAHRIHVIMIQYGNEVVSGKRIVITSYFAHSIPNTIATELIILCFYLNLSLNKFLGKSWSSSLTNMCIHGP